MSYATVDKGKEGKRSMKQGNKGKNTRIRMESGEELCPRF